MAGSVYELAILLSLKDAASGGLGRVEDRLRATGKTGRATLQTFQDLRSELKKDLSISGVGVASLLALRKGLDVAGDYESALLDIRSAYQESAAAGALSMQEQEAQLKGLGNLAVDLGNKLQGNTQNYVGILTALKQAGVPGKEVLGGAGRSAAYLANVSGALARGQEREQAKELGQFGLMFKLRPEEFEESVNLFSALKDKFDIESSSLIESAKYFQATSNQLGIAGTKGAGDTVKFFALLKRQAGMEGSMAGTGARAFFMQLATEEKKLAALKKAKGIDIKPFDEKGNFRGYEAIFKEMEKFRTLNQQESAKWLNAIFGERGQEVASAMVKVGFEGWEKVTAETAKAVPVNEKINQQMATYNAKVEALTGSIQNLTATAFMPMLDTVKPIVDIANLGAGALQSWSSANPGITQLAGSLFGMGAVGITVVGGIRAMTTAWRMWRIASSVGVSETGQLTFLRTLRKEATATSTALGTATTKAAGLRSALGGIPAQIGVMIALEYTIAKGFDLYQEIQNYKEAQAGERRADEMGAKSLATVESDYKKRSEPVPKDVYSGRASVALESLNRGGQLRESLEPGSHFLRETARFFTFQKPNPYVGSFGSFEPRTAISDFRERAPELGNTEVMRAFIAELGKFKLPAEQQGQFGLAEIQRKEIAQTLQAAFPESYQQATLSVTKGLTDMQQPLTMFPTSLGKASDSAARLAGNFDRFSNRLAGFELPTMPSITIPGSTTGQPGQTTSLPTKPAASHSYQVFPSKAAGGLVLKGGFVEVHDREAIVPARVTDRWKEETFRDRRTDSTSLISQLISMKESTRQGGPVVVNVTIGMPRSEPRLLSPASGSTWYHQSAASPAGVDGSYKPQPVLSQLSNLRSEVERSVTRVNDLRLIARNSATTRESVIQQFANLRSESFNNRAESTRLIQSLSSSATRSQQDSSLRTNEVRESVIQQFANLRSETSDKRTTALTSKHEVRESLIHQFSKLRSESSGTRTDSTRLIGSLRNSAVAPERVQLRPEVARAVVTERGAAERPVQVTVHYSPNIQIDGGGNPEQVAQKLQSVLEQHSRDLGDEVVRQIEYQLEIQRERA